MLFSRITRNCNAIRRNIFIFYILLCGSLPSIYHSTLESFTMLNMKEKIFGYFFRYNI